MTRYIASGSGLRRPSSRHDTAASGALLVTSGGYSIFPVELAPLPLQFQQTWFEPPPVQSPTFLSLAAGTVYNDSRTETAATGDTFAAAVVFASSLTETAATSDTYAPNTSSPPTSRNVALLSSTFFTPWQAPPPVQIPTILTRGGGAIYNDSRTETAATSDTLSNQHIGYELYNTAGAGLPTGHSTQWVTANVTYTVAAGALDSVVTVNGRHGVSVDRAGDADIEQLAKFKISAKDTSGSANPTYQLAARGSGAAGSEQCYRVGLVQSAGVDQLTIAKLVAGTPTNLSTFNFTYTTGVNYWIRFLVSGTSLSAKVWADGSPEPGAYQTTTADSAVTGTGWAGHVFFFAGTSDVDFYSFGTNGAAAPGPFYGAFGPSPLGLNDQDVFFPPWRAPPPIQLATVLSKAAGAVYNDSVAETAATSDSFSASAVFASSLSETAATSDSYTASVIFVSSLTETAATSDQFQLAPIAFVGTQAYPNYAGYMAWVPPFMAPPVVQRPTLLSKSAGAVYNDSVAETAATSDSFASTAIYNVSVTETAATGDTWSVTGGQPSIQPGGSGSGSDRRKKKRLKRRVTLYERKVEAEVEETPVTDWPAVKIDPEIIARALGITRPLPTAFVEAPPISVEKVAEGIEALYDDDKIDESAGKAEADDEEEVLLALLHELISRPEAPKPYQPPPKLDEAEEEELLMLLQSLL